VAIAAFEGWNDAAEAASGVVNHLGIAWESTPIAAIDPDDFYDFQVNRPVIEVVGGKTERLVWPTTRLSLARASDTGLPRDIVRAKGIVRFAGRDWQCLFSVTCGRPELTWVKLPAVTENQAVFIGRHLERHEKALRAQLAGCETVDDGPHERRQTHG